MWVPPTMDELASLSEEQRQQALERFRLLQPHLEQGKPLVQVAREAGIPFRTAQRWVGRYEKFGLAALARKVRADRSQRRSLSPELLEIVEGLALQRPALSIANLYRRVYQLSEARGEKPPSYTVIYEIVRALPPDPVTFAQQGSKVYGETYELIHRREADRPNAIWQADHTLLDILLVKEDGTTGRPWLTLIEDDYSRAIAGYFLYFEAPTALQTALALRQAIWRKEEARWHVCGIPEVLYTDNGSDFTSRHLEQVAADLKIQLVLSIPGRPRGRGRIERLFETVNQMYLAGQPGYLARDGGMKDKPKLTLSDLDRGLRDFFIHHYHQRVHSETKCAPQERWEKGGFLPRHPEALEQLDLLLLTVAKARKVHPDGIRFLGFRYVDTTLAAYVGEAVILRYDPRDVAEIRVFHQGRFVCRAVCPDLAGETVPLREVIRARNRRRREVRGILKDRRKTVDALLELKRGSPEPQPEAPTEPRRADPPLKRYFNE